MCLISDYGKYGSLPPHGRGFYLKLPTKDYLNIKKQYDLKKSEYEKGLNRYLNKGVQNSLF